MDHHQPVGEIGTPSVGDTNVQCYIMCNFLVSVTMVREIHEGDCLTCEEALYPTLSDQDSPCIGTVAVEWGDLVLHSLWHTPQ